MTEPTYGRGMAAYDDAQPVSEPVPSAIGTAPAEDLTRADFIARKHAKPKKKTVRRKRAARVAKRARLTGEDAVRLFCVVLGVMARSGR